MSKILIRSGEREFSVADMDGLLELVRGGKLGRAAQIKLPKARKWIRADSVSEIATFFKKDIWAAWDGDTDEDLLSAFKQPSEEMPTPPPEAPQRVAVEELPVSAVAPVDDEPKVESSPLAPTEPPVTPQETTHPHERSPAAGPRRPGGKLIAFPTIETPLTHGANALDVLSRPVQDVKPSSQGRRVRWGRLMVIAGVGALTMLTWVWYVNMNATAQFVARSAVETTQELPRVLTDEEVAVEIAISPYEALEDDLREQLKEGILDIPGVTEFEDALMIELRRVRLNVGFVRVKIGSWAGRKKDLPDNVGFQIKLNTKEGNLDRDLGALGLVMGKYIQHYGINATEVSVLIESGDGMRKVRMNPEVARRFFTHRESLEQFLSTAFVVNE